MTDKDETASEGTEAEQASPADDAVTDSAELPTPEEWAQAQTDLEALRKEVREAQLRNLAELDNVRKRATRDTEQARKFGAEKLLRDLLAIVDSLDLAIKAGVEGSAGSVLEGVALTRKQFTKVLAKHDVVEINPAGEKLDPELHEAVAAIDTTDVPAGHVVEVMQTGYRLHERLLRPARVVVAKT